MKPEHLKTVQEYFGFLKNPPSIVLKRDDACAFDEQIIEIDGGSLVIRDTVPPYEAVEVQSIGGARKLPGFVLETIHYYHATRWEPEDIDYDEKCKSQRFDDVALEAVKVWLADQIRCRYDGIEPDFTEQEAR